MLTVDVGSEIWVGGIRKEIGLKKKQLGGFNKKWTGKI